MSIPVGTKFIGISPNVNTTERKSAQANSPSEVYTIEDIKDGGVPDSRTITINGTTSDLTANRTYTVTDANLSTSDITTNNVSTSKHGFAPKAPNDIGQFLSGDGTWRTINTGITVGTTAVTSGTDGRVFFQAGGVVQQDSAFFWDNTNKRLGIGANATSPNSALFIRTNLTTANDVLDIQNGQYGNPLFRIRDMSTASPIANFFFSGLIFGGNSGVTRRFDLGGFGLGASFGDSVANAVWENNQGNIGDGQGTSVIAVSSNLYVNLQTTKKYKFEAVTGNFGIGNVGTLGARLDVRAQGALSTDIAFRVRNSADTANLIEIAGNNTMTFLSTAGKAIFSSSGSGANLSMRRDFSNEEMIKINAGDFPFIEVKPINTTSHIAVGTLANGASTWWDGVNYNFQIKNSFHNLFHVVGNPNSATATFRLGTIASNTNFFNIHGRNTGGTGLTTNPVFTINSSGTVGIGTEASTPGARLDVRAQGALSTDIAFRVRNSADTQNLYSQDGTGVVLWRNNAGNRFMYWDAATLLQLGAVGGQTLNINAESTAVTRITTTSDILYSGVSTHVFVQYKNGNFQIEQASGIVQTSGEGGLSLKNGTAPTASSADRFIQYSADITAGNAAPHFRTENGAIVKVYQETTGVGASTLVTGVGTPLTDTDTFDGYTLKQIVKALRNQGLLA